MFSKFEKDRKVPDMATFMQWVQVTNAPESRSSLPLWYGRYKYDSSSITNDRRINVMSLPAFLPRDNKNVISEYRCIYSCLGRIEEKLFKGDFEEVKLSIQDLYRSVNEVEKNE
ncbi:hypothetical protein RCO48_04445 [Peribacillus frigoritolerans]|nr:hypothetical protein [Peribacillus frigoritolerans]